MPIDFPSSPTLNQSFTAGGNTWIWSGTTWTLQRIPTGAQGPKGDTGEQGIQGVPGPQGTSINVKNSVATVALLPTTGNSANDARIVDADGDLYIWGGTSWSSAGQIVGPQGIQGEQGIQGIQGAQGLKGDKGDQGDQGAQGPQGPQGSQGLQGVPGETGQQGLPGASFPSQLNNSGKFLSTNGTDPQWTQLSFTPADNSITNAMLAGSIENSKLANSSITVNGSAVALGGSVTVASTAYSNGTNTANSNKIFYNNTGTPPTGTAAGDLYVFY